MRNWTAIVIFFGMFSSAANAAIVANDYGCQLSESYFDLNFESSFSFPLNAAGEGIYDLASSKGGLTSGTFVVQAGRSIWRLVDSTTGLMTTFSSSAAEGDSAKLFFMSGIDTDDRSLNIGCRRGEPVVSPKTPAAFACMLSEVYKGDRTEVSFTVPVASGGHDYTDLPPHKIPLLGGWVMPYDGNVIVFLNHKEVYHGVTALGSWAGGISLTWHPVDGAEATVSCDPM